METTKWSLDPTHSEIHFKVKHFMISTVTGQFNKFEGKVETQGDDLSTAKVHFTAEVDSITTNNEQRDGHLKSTDFFDSENHPQLVFEGNQLVKTEGDNYKLSGSLTMRGISKSIILDVEFGGKVVDPYGLTRVGFNVTGVVNRKDFGVNFSMVSETGGILLSDEVKIIANAEFVMQVVKEPVAV